MAYRTLVIENGPGQRDLELAFIARNLGAVAEFTIIAQDRFRMKVRLRIYNFSLVTYHSPKYMLGGHLVGLSTTGRERLPPHFNFINVEYDVGNKTGVMEFSFGE